MILIAVIVVLGVGALLDLAITHDRIYTGVTLGTLDLGGKTRTEAAALITQTYGDAVSDMRAVVFDDEEEASTFETDGVLSKKALDDSWDDIVADADAGNLWIADSATVGATLPAEALAEEAFAVGRDNGGFFTRLGTLFSGYALSPRATYASSDLEALAASIDNATGEALKEYTITIQDGQASVSVGQDGYHVSRDELKTAFDAVIFAGDTAGCAVLAIPQYQSVTTNESQASALAQKINDALGHELIFTCEGATIKPDRDDVGSWIDVSTTDPKTGREGTDGTLYATLNPDDAESFIASQIHGLIKDSYTVSLENANGEILAHPSAGAPLPMIGAAIETLDDGLFDLSEPAMPTENEASQSSEETWPETMSVPIEVGEAPSTLSFEEALQSGLIVAISSYTTEYPASSANRIINIHLAADLINDSITNPNETWSFLDNVGDPTVEAGFVGAGVIMANEHQDAIGGGICQVATTVFNAVYEAGLPIVERYNHSIYLSNYPDGRDAAVAYPTLDLKWENDTTSSVLLGADYTDASLTITLYGVDPGYEVTSKVGQWVAGAAHGARTRVDENLSPGVSYVETYGQDGRSISVTRTVENADGEELRTDTFYSTYAPEDKVTVIGG